MFERGLQGQIDNFGVLFLQYLYKRRIVRNCSLVDSYLSSNKSMESHTNTLSDSQSGEDLKQFLSLHADVSKQLEVKILNTSNSNLYGNRKSRSFLAN